jgi:hypothetical protein
MVKKKKKKPSKPEIIKVDLRNKFKQRGEYVKD